MKNYFTRGIILETEDGTSIYISQLCDNSIKCNIKYPYLDHAIECKDINYKNFFKLVLWFTGVNNLTKREYFNLQNTQDKMEKYFKILKI